MDAKGLLQDLLQVADIQLDGNRPEDLHVHNPQFYDRVLAGRSMALGESYMDGWWDCEAPDRFFSKVFRANLSGQFSAFRALRAHLYARLLNQQSPRRSQKVAKIHYDLGNDFYRDMLDPWMQYTCGYWPNAANLAEAQEHKLDLICRKLHLKEDDHVLELGGGWGGFARFAAERYGCRVTTYNISREQVKHASEWNRGLPVEVVHKDYREATGNFDKVVSIGLCEHIGFKNHRRLMEVKESCLKKNGLMLLHTIGRNTESKVVDPWIEKYIFPGGHLPCLKQIAAATEGLFILEDAHNFGPDYDRTLLAWHENYRNNWPNWSGLLGERFDRMWNYYLLSCAGAFRSRGNQLWQFVFSKEGSTEAYVPAR